MKSILFTTEDVRAILDGRKTAVRRAIRLQPKSKLVYIFGGYKHGKWSYPAKDAWKYWEDESFKLADDMTDKEKDSYWTPPYHRDDVIYVRETWGTYTPNPERCYPSLYFKASESKPPHGIKWQSPATMPRDHARLFLRVKGVSVERLQDITINGLQDEGLLPQGYISQYAVMSEPTIFEEFKKKWDRTIRPIDHAIYCWAANPWVWVIEFERIEKEEE